MKPSTKYGLSTAAVLSLVWAASMIMNDGSPENRGCRLGGDADASIVDTGTGDTLMANKTANNPIVINKDGTSCTVIDNSGRPVYSVPVVK